MKRFLLAIVLSMCFIIVACTSYVYGEIIGDTMGYQQGYHAALSECVSYPFLLLDQNQYVACKR